MSWSKVLNIDSKGESVITNGVILLKRSLGAHRKLYLERVSSTIGSFLHKLARVQWDIGKGPYLLMFTI